VASSEHTFDVLKEAENYYRSNMGQDHLNGITTLNINCNVALKLHFPLIINALSEKRARKEFVK
jgi:hypothetical protein